MWMRIGFKGRRLRLLPRNKNYGDDDDEFERTIYTDKEEWDFEEDRLYKEEENEEINAVTSNMAIISLKRG